MPEVSGPPRAAGPLVLGGIAGKGPVRGFPPVPGQPPPVYPPGQFAAWNRPASQRPAAPGAGRTAGHSWPAPPAVALDEPGYAVLAVSDPSADVTVTQTWAVVSDTPATEPAAATTVTMPPARPATGPGGAAGSAAPARPATGPGGAAARPATGPGGAAGSAAPARPATGPGGGGGGGGGGGPAPGRRRLPPRPRPHRWRNRILLVAAVVIVLAAGGWLAFWYLARHISAAPPARPAASQAAVTPSSPPASPSPTPSLGRWGHIASRATDPIPLSVAELYPRRFSAAGISYSKTTQRRSANCTRAVVGSRLRLAIKHAGCTQVLRASYLSASKVMGTIGVLNLRTATVAKRAGRAAGPAGLIAVLPGRHGPTKRLTKGTGIEEAEVKGHYLILIWAEFTDLRAPHSRARRARLENFCAQVIKNTANVSLARRMVTGRP
jgi:hypothetical protein